MYIDTLQKRIRDHLFAVFCIELLTKFPLPNAHLGGCAEIVVGKGSTPQKRGTLGFPPKKLACRGCPLKRLSIGKQRVSPLKNAHFEKMFVNQDAFDHDKG